MSFTTTYFLCPTSEFVEPPPAGPLSLGAIIRSTSSPQLPLNRGNIPPVVNTNTPVVETDWKKTVSGETGFGLGVYAQFLQLVTDGLGPQVDVQHLRRRTNTFAFYTMTTIGFEPTPEYVGAAVKAPAVQAYLREPKQRFAPVVSLFLVTGIKLVKGAKIKYSTSGSTGVRANIGTDLTAIGMSFGPKGHWTRMNDDETEFSRDSEFVFAFRVKRLRFGRRLKMDEYNKGTFLAIGKDKSNDETEPVLVDDVDGSEIENAKLVLDVTENDSVYCVPA